MINPRVHTTRGVVSLRVIALAIVVVSSAYALTATRRDEAPLRLADGGLPNVLLITVDTLRADHLGYPGRGPSGLTRSMDALAKQGAAFLAASTPAPTTRAAIAALLTGSYRGRHGVLGNAWSLGRGVPVLAERLQMAGYRTAAFFGNRLLAAAYGFGRGFDEYESFAEVHPLGGSKDEVGVARARAWLEGRPREPWFLWLHLMDPHGPYSSAPASVRRETDRHDAMPERVLSVSPRNTGLGVIPRYQALRGVRRASAYRWRYRAEVKYSDAQIGKLLGTLDDLGLSADTLVVLAADHGEGLGEHEYFFQHGWFTYEESVAVPLVFRLPGRVGAGVRLDAAVSLVDVAPTILGGLGLEIPPGVQGRDLSSALVAVGPREVAEKPVFSASTLLSGISSVRIGRFKLVHTPPPPNLPGEDPWAQDREREESFRLYDLVRDPGELTDVAAEHPRRVAEMRSLLRRWEREQALGWGAPQASPVDSRLRQALEALGYTD